MLLKPLIADNSHEIPTCLKETSKCDLSREKGRVGCHKVKFTFSAFWMENFMTNQEILTCWWVLDHFGSQNVQRRWVRPWSVTNFLLTLLWRYMYIIKSSRLTHIIKYCKRTLQCICCNQFSFVFFYLLFSHYSSSISSANVAPDIFSSLQLHFSVNT